MELKIYNRKGVLKLTVSPSDNATRQKRLMSDHVLNLSFTAFACVPLEVFDYADFGGVRFWVMEEYAPKQTSTVEWEYDCNFYGIESLMKQALVLKTVDGENNPIFSLTAPAREHMALIVENINRQMGTTDWKVGEVIATENLTLDYEGTYCDEALSMLSEAAKTEYWADGMTLNLCRCAYGEEVVLGYDNGLESLEREAADNIKFFTRLFPIGSTRNIDPEEYGYSRLQLPGRKAYVEQNTHLGIVEHYEQEAFSAIYPRRVGTLSGVRSEQRTGEDGKPFMIYYVKDASLTFDPNSYEIAGLVKQMTFQSGELNGRDFEVNYDSKRKEFEIITQWPYDDDTQLPGGVLVPKAGDEYILWNIRMPQEYYALAEQEFAEAVDDYLREHDQDRYVYKGRTDYVEVAQRKLSLDVGQRVRLESDEYFPGVGYRTSRITSITQNLQRPTEIDIEVSDVVGKGALEKINDDLGEVRHYAKTASAGLPDIVRSWENTPASDTNLYSSRKSEETFLNRLRGGRVEGQTRFGRELLLDGGFRTPDFASGLAGTGARIDSRGDAELESLRLRRFLDVPELRYNRVEVTMGDRWSAVCAGVIGWVDTQNRIITLKLEAGEIGTPRTGDICMGIFHSTALAENAAEDFDDGRGNRRFAGFATCYFRVAAIEDFGTDTYARFRYELRPASERYPVPLHPQAMMTFVGYGSFTDPARRSSRYETRTYQRYLTGVDDWEFGPEHVAAQFGDLRNLTVGDVEMGGYSAYLNHIYMSGVVRQFTPAGEEVPTINDRGVWAPGEVYDRNDDVHWSNARWRCTTDGTTTVPAEDDPRWLLLERAPKGDPGAPGQPGEPGQPGQPGPVHRVTEWAEGVEYHNDAQAAGDDLRFIDIVVRRIGGTQYRFRCLKTHRSTAANAPSPQGGADGCWAQLNDLTPIYTPLLLAKNAVIDFLQGNSIRIMDDSGGAYAVLEAGEYPLYVGASSPEEAPFRVSRQGAMNCTLGQIGGFTISATSLVSKSAAAGYGELYLSSESLKFASSLKKTKVHVGTDVLPASAGDNVCPMYVENKDTSFPTMDNIGIYIDVEGARHETAGISGNHALTIARGDVCGLRPHLREISGNTTLSTLDHTVFIASGAPSSLTLTLPAVAEIGQVFEVYNPNKKTIYIKLSTGTQIIYSSYMQIKIIKRGSGNTVSDWAVFRTPTEA